MKDKKQKKEKKQKEIIVEKDYNGATNYNVYHMSLIERFFYTAMAAVGLFVLGYIFYHNIIISAFFALLAVKYPGI